jgi:hypothetical protein
MSLFWVEVESSYPFFSKCSVHLKGMEDDEEDVVDMSKAANNNNVTVVSFTCNSNKVIKTEVGFREFEQEMETLWQGPLAKQYKRYIFGDKSIVSKVEATSFEVEVGRKKKENMCILPILFITMQQSIQ